MTPRQALVIVPTLNERESLPVLVSRLMRHPTVSVLVVDDASPDGTGQIADALAREYSGRIEIMHRTERPGLGRSYIAGMRRVIDRPLDVICQMDCDLSHDPDQLPDLISATDRADIAIGSRYVEGGRVENWPLRRQLLSRYANVYVRLITRMGVHDCTSGYRCWRREALRSLPLERFESDGYSLMVEMLYAAAARGYRIAEIPITFVERRHGQSKLSGTVLFESILTPWRLVATRTRISQDGR